MNSDIKLGEAVVIVEGDALQVHCTDLILDCAGRRGMVAWKPGPDKNPARPRRAVVHDGNDGLTLNYANDYPGGVSVEGDVKLAAGVSVHGDVNVGGELLVKIALPAPPHRELAEGRMAPKGAGQVLAPQFEVVDVGKTLAALRQQIAELQQELAALKK